MNTEGSVPLGNLDPLVVNAFQTIRYLSQVGEAIGFAFSQRVVPDGAERFLLHVVTKCCDRAEHVAQEFVPASSFGTWSDKRAFIRDSMLDDVSWMLQLFTAGGSQGAALRDTLAQVRCAYPRSSDLTALAKDLEAIPCAGPLSAAADPA